MNLADNTDARMETLTEIFAADKSKKEWLGFNRIFESNLRRDRRMVIFMEYRKNDIVTLKIEDCGIDGEGIGKG